MRQISSFGKNLYLSVLLTLKTLMSKPPAGIHPCDECSPAFCARTGGPLFSEGNEIVPVPRSLVRQVAITHHAALPDFFG
jgi:hypothetical protein